jgi:hypothetical protein
MNVFEDESQDIAETIMRRIIDRGGRWDVFCRRDGLVAMESVASPTRSYELPEADKIGTYSKGAEIADIRDDLNFRRQELANRRAA